MAKHALLATPRLSGVSRWLNNGYYDCPWVPAPDGTTIRWNKSQYGENYAEWLQLLLDHFLIPWDYVLNGSASWEETGHVWVESFQVGLIVVVDNEVKQITWEDVEAHWREIVDLL